MHSIMIVRFRFWAEYTMLWRLFQMTDQKQTFFEKWSILTERSRRTFPAQRAHSSEGAMADWTRSLSLNLGKYFASIFVGQMLHRITTTPTRHTCDKKVKSRSSPPQRIQNVRAEVQFNVLVFISIDYHRRTCNIRLDHSRLTQTTVDCAAIFHLHSPTPKTKTTVTSSGEKCSGFL